MSVVDLDALARWVRAEGIGKEIGEVVPLAGGTQNVVLKIELDGRPVVLRRPPEHPRPTSDRTLTREITVLRGLADTDVPHPRLIAGCTDTAVLGVVFYLMELVAGVNPGEGVSEAQRADAALRHGQGLAVARALSRLGAVDPVAQGLDVLRKPGSFLGKQVPQWLAQLESYREFPGWEPGGLPAVSQVATWLEENRPPDAAPGVMHGDFHLNNVLLASAAPEVAAIVDWEMCTVGDPLLDLGWLMVTWPEAPRAMDVGGPFAQLGGLPSRAELVEAYAAAGGRAPEHVDWYTALAGFKLGIVLEGTWARASAGKAPQEVGERLHTHAVGLLDLAATIVRGDWSVLGRR
ncbi:phosphotransferase family protein [Pseudonocardia pini]|uniref:phosphotransferase family protein n=1 Tax=Pseudonocardia pini TaxID=2758030 RepID=UPI0015F08F3B|nr:phosphotransferase family protein [Pseudonocardia pini]